LVENKIIENIADIYKLSDPAIQIQLLKFPWFGDKKAAEIAKGVEESKHKALRRLLNGLWIAHVGKKMAQDLAEQLTSKDFFEQVTNEEFLRSIYWIGEKTVESITSFFHDAHNLKLLEQLEQAGVNFDPQKYTDLIKADEAKGTFSITGSFDLPREKIAELFQQQGYLFHESPIKTTNFMLIGDKAGSKKTKAQELWITIYEWRETIVNQFPFLKKVSSETSKPKTQSLF
jgi:DNA ligase (NAD+)